MQSSTARQLPFAHLNLRFNPFGEMDLDERADMAIVDVERIVAQLKHPHFAVQFIGEKGHGKTTHLLALKERFPQAAYVHIGEGQRPALPIGNPVLIDEAQRLGRLRRRRLFRCSVPLVLGTHRDFTRQLVQAGRTVQTVWPQASMCRDRLAQLLNTRIQHARRTPGELPRITTETAQALIDQFGTDVRAIEGAMYDRFQNLDCLRDV